MAAGRIGRGRGSVVPSIEVEPRKAKMTARRDVGGGHRYRKSGPKRNPRREARSRQPESVSGKEELRRAVDRLLPGMGRANPRTAAGAEDTLG